MKSVASFHSNLSLGRSFQTRVLDLGKVVAATRHSSVHDPHSVRTYPILGQVCALWETLPHAQWELKIYWVPAPWRRPERNMGTWHLLKALAASCAQAPCCPEAESWARRGSVTCPDRQEQGSLGWRWMRGWIKPLRPNPHGLARLVSSLATSLTPFVQVQKGGVGVAFHHLRYE